jgi:prepilin-type N-terminal cleavage/methylation domain-containing protein
MSKRNAGFTLVEMLIVIAIFGFVLVGTSQMFIDTLRTHRQQSRITETNIEGIIGLELLRQDLVKAGYGLPWSIPNTVAYNEAGGAPANGYNDCSGVVPCNPPRGISGADDVTGVAGIPDHTDYLVIKAANVATNTACNKWTFLLESGGTSTVTWWTPSSENLSSTDRVIVIAPGTPDSPTARALITGSTQFSAAAGFAAPVSGPETRLVYGIDTADPNPLRMPFNRADYFVRQPSSSEMPRRCALGTGILYKAVVNQNGGGLSYMPLLDCVADMQVIFRYTNNTGNLTTIQTYDDISVFNAEAVRNQVKEVRVFILAHEGQRDTNYQHPESTPHVGDSGIHGRDYDLTTITNWQNYRWKIYTLVVQLDNLR